MRGIKTKARFPAKSVNKYYGNSSDDFLSHTGSNRGVTYTKDDGHKGTVTKKDYKDRIISIAKYTKLYNALKKIDPVYAVMAQTMMQTFLRVGNTCEMPLHTDRFNKYFPTWPEYKREKGDAGTQKFRCIAKGQKLITIDIYPFTIEAIYNDYIKPHFHERKALYESKYMTRKNGSLRYAKGRYLPEDILWLNENGAPVKPYMVEQAFRDTGLGINPHMLRHSGASHTLWNYCDLNGISPDVRLAAQFQEILQDQLGHASLETTRMYIRTILKDKASKFMPFAIPQKKKMTKAAKKKFTAEIESETRAFFKGRAEVI